MFIMCLTMGLIPLIQWGPYWFSVSDIEMNCKTYWWANVLLINNVLYVDDIVSLNFKFKFNFLTYSISTTVFLNILFPNFSTVYSLVMVLVS